MHAFVELTNTDRNLVAVALAAIRMVEPRQGMSAPTGSRVVLDDGTFISVAMPYGDVMTLVRAAVAESRLDRNSAWREAIAEVVREFWHVPVAPGPRIIQDADGRWPIPEPLTPEQA